ncbi:hypothetical protein C817_00339 [Dorea sp. 5-2]|nr:hypothetical protein C817_00339 [Dorea sp. 5-2]
MMEDKNITFSMSGGQINYARDNGIIYATQNNGSNSNRLDIILKEIMENLSDIKKEEADKIRDVVDMAKEELMKPDPKVSRLRNCVTLIAPMLTIANGIPTLTSSLQKLVDYIKPFIH